MGKKMQGSNSSGPTKAGKKHSFIEPSKPNFDKRDASLKGEQQFVRVKGMRIGRIIPADQNTDVLDALCRAFSVTRKPHKIFDTGYRLDSSRGRVIVPEGEYTNGY